MESNKSWGSKNGSKRYYEQGNRDIVNLHRNIMNINELFGRFTYSMI